jgi:replicative DNA helicase
MAEEPNFRSINLTPPQNIEVEEAILGGILLDPEAIGRVAEKLIPEAFYTPTHAEIYKAALALSGQGKPTDLITVTDWLIDRQQLEKIGGQAKLIQLLERTVSAVNIDSLAVLVMDKYIRRELIKAGTEVTQLGYAADRPLEIVLDESEQQILNLTQARPKQGLTPIKEIVTATYQEIQDRHDKIIPPGLTSDFSDLDGMTGGFQRSDLIIIAGRPSMGKTAISLNIAYNMAKLHKLPVLVFSLEMSKDQLVQRLIASEAGIDSNRLRSGRISPNEWDPVYKAVDRISELPIYIDDNASMMLMEMRSQARKLQAEHGGQLGLIMIDYLQLMEGGGDNRVQEISKITRGLKGLARELQVPLIALSQLSRSVEARNNKRPMMSDLRESGCLTGDTLITLADTGVQVPIQDLVDKSNFAVWALDEKNMQLKKAFVSHAFGTGIKPVWKLQTQLGRTIRATANHQFLTIHGWKRLDELTIDDRLAVPRKDICPNLEQSMSDGGLALLGHLIGDGCTLPRHSIQYTTREPDLAQTVANLATEIFGDRIVSRIQRQLGNNYCGTSLYKHNVSRERASKIATITKSIEIENLANSDVYWDKIVAISPDGESDVYDLTVPQFHNFIANNIIAHNSIEQDADLIIMLYRDAYYNPDTPDRDITELIITKHRNGPTGVVKLVFDPALTKFKNLARPMN